MDAAEKRRDTGSLSTLWLPLREAAGVWLATLALFAYYAWTSSRDLSLYDSGELALAAVSLGLGHPPGQPLHTLLGFLLSHLPAVPALYGVALASIIPGALTLVPATSLAQTLLGRSAPPAAQRALPWLIALGALHPVLWESATRVEVYALATFFAVWAVARLSFPADATQNLAPKHVLAAGLALGLAASVNPMVALCVGLAVAPALLLRIARKQLPLHTIALAVLGGLIGLVPYAYLFAVANRTDVMIWGAPRDTESLRHYLLLKDYDSNHALTLPLWANHFAAWFPWAAEHWLAPLLGLGLAAHVELGPRSTLGRSVGPLLLMLLVAQISFNVVWNLDVPDYDGYVASALWVLLAGATAYAGHGFAAGKKLAAGMLAAAVVVCSLVATPNAFARTRQRDHVARALAEEVLREAPPHAIVIAELDYLAGSLFYLQEAEHARPDVVVIAYGLASSSWHWERIFRMHPDLTAITLAGPGGKPGRVRRLLDANAQRPVLVERLALVSALHLQACWGGLYLRTGRVCETPKPIDDTLAKQLAHTLDELGSGSPGSAGALAQISFGLGETLWRIGDARAAYVAFLSGVPRSMRPAGLLPAPLQLRSVPALRAALPAFQRNAALGDPARNLFLAGMLLQAAGKTELARACGSAAADQGLPEALGGSQPGP